MAIIKSAKKAHRQSLRRRVFNIRRARAMKDAVADFKKALAKGDAAGRIPELYQSIDKAVKQNIINKNAGARMKSRLVKRLSTGTK